MYQRALVSVAKGTEAIAYIGAFGIVAFGNNGIYLNSGKCQKRQRIAGNREKGIWDSGESHSSAAAALRIRLGAAQTGILYTELETVPADMMTQE